MADDALFDATLISPAVAASLPPSYTLRPLQRADVHAGFLDVLRVLTAVGDISAERWTAQYDWMRRRNQDSISSSSHTSTSSPSTGSPSASASASHAAASSDCPKCHGEYFILVISDGAKIVGTGTLLVERKFIHDLGRVGHIEDIAVAKDQQGKKLGLRMIQALDYVAEAIGCYKSILDCSDANEGFYLKCGFRRVGLQMAHYYEATKK